MRKIKTGNIFIVVLLIILASIGGGIYYYSSLPAQKGYQSRFMMWANQEWFEAGFYFRGINSEKVDLEFEVEGNEPVWISNMTVYAHPDAIIREFEHGLVLANPSDHEYTFNLEALTPQRTYRRLTGSSKQDPRTNDGSLVGSSVTLGPRDGLFLVATDTLTAADGSDEDALGLEIFDDGYPRAYFFRASESYAASGQYSFEEWDAIFSRLSGIEGKVLDEEIPGRSASNIEYFVSYKQKYPEKLVLLHYNGNARDPRYRTENFFAGHWVYYQGCRIIEDVPAEEGETNIRVEDATLFRVNIGRYGNSKEDICLCLLDSDGKPDWQHSEQVQLVSVDPDRRLIRVRRGCFGTEPMAFPANKSYAAAHVSEGPWGSESNMLWFYNYSPFCPKDSQGRTCVDVLVDDVASHFLPGGDLECFDGLEFDVLYHQLTRPYSAGRKADTDGDGLGDNGWIDGVNAYGAGVYNFCQRLRLKLGEEKLILADGMSVGNQRCFGVLNGIESEGWPNLSDLEVEDWSGGMNRHLFWNQNARSPVFSYINHKFINEKLPATDPRRNRPSVPFNIHRLVFAAGQFFDAAICYSYAPEPEPGEAFGIWDELYMGVEHKTSWLGFPLGPPLRLALQTKDLLEGAGEEMRLDLVQRFEGENVRFTLEDDSLRVSSAKQGEDRLAFKLKDVPCEGPDLFISLKIRAAEMKDYPVDIARLVWVGIVQPKA